MRFISLAAGVFHSLICFTSATLIPRQSTATKFATVGGWIENIVVQPNGNLLATRLDTPELWTVDIKTREASKLISFSDSLALTGIYEATPDVYAVVAGSFNATTGDTGAGSYKFHWIDLTGPAPVIKNTTSFPLGEFLIGITPFNRWSFLVADAGRGAIYACGNDRPWGFYANTTTDPRAAKGSSVNKGIHGLKFRYPYAYFTNTFDGTFARVSVNGTYGVADKAVEPIVTKGLPDPEDFVLLEDESALVATNSDGVYRVSKEGVLNKVVDVEKASSVAFGRTEGDKDVLYISTRSGDIFAAKRP